MALKIFISHQGRDSALALSVARRIEVNRMEYYLDIVDDAVIQDGPELAEIIRDKMSKCDQLLAVVSNNTATSWWVPWEIGVATEKNFRLGTYTESYFSLPSYLKKWPVLRSMSDVDVYCEESKGSERTASRWIEEALTASGREAARRRSAAEFHKALMRRLQR